MITRVFLNLFLLGLMVLNYARGDTNGLLLAGFLWVGVRATGWGRFWQAAPDDWVRRAGLADDWLLRQVRQQNDVIYTTSLNGEEVRRIHPR